MGLISDMSSFLVSDFEEMASPGKPVDFVLITDSEDEDEMPGTPILDQRSGKHWNLLVSIGFPV